MKAQANTTISVLRGTAVDDYDDDRDLDQTVGSRIIAAISEARRTIKRTDSTTPERVRSFTGRVGAGTDVQRGDRVKDEQTATIYIVDDVVEQPGFQGHTPDMRLDLRRVD